MKNKNKAKTQSQSQVRAAVQHDHPGRPRYEMVYPPSLTFTATELMAVNGVDTRKYMANGHVNKNEGKGLNCTKLTINKNLKHALATGKIFPMKGYKAASDSDSGMGRRPSLYRHKSTSFSDALIEAKARDAGKAKATRKVNTKAPTATLKQTLEAAQAILAEPTTVVTIAPAPAPAPVIPIAPTPEPVATVPTVDTKAVSAEASVVPAPAPANIEPQPLEITPSGVTTTCEA
jgi:hypothetical protein